MQFYGTTVSKVVINSEAITLVGPPSPTYPVLTTFTLYFLRSELSFSRAVDVPREHHEFLF